MSQAKVDQYKEYKKNRKEILAKQKKRQQINRILSWAAAIVILGGLGGAVGVSIYNSYQAKLAALPDYTSSTSFIVSDWSGIQDADNMVSE
ncbi:MAG: hypothetical protein ACI4C1_03285 [Lachnospiraceae bacterium]